MPRAMTTGGGSGGKEDDWEGNNRSFLPESSDSEFESKYEGDLDYNDSDESIPEKRKKNKAQDVPGGKQTVRRRSQARNNSAANKDKNAPKKSKSVAVKRSRAVPGKTMDTMSNGSPSIKVEDSSDSDSDKEPVTKENKRKRFAKVRYYEQDIQKNYLNKSDMGG